MLCEYCLERGLVPNEHIGFYQDRPICDPCLAPIYDNANATQVEDIAATDLVSRKAKAMELLDKFEDFLRLSRVDEHYVSPIEDEHMQTCCIWHIVYLL
jgi:hypothetical protein